MLCLEPFSHSRLEQAPTLHKKIKIRNLMLIPYKIKVLHTSIPAQITAWIIWHDLGLSLEVSRGILGKYTLLNFLWQI